MTETETLTFAPLTADDLPAAVALSRAERWPHRPEDWALFLGLGRGVGARQGGRLVGTAMAMPFGPVATACMIIVASEMRGRGLGRRVMEQAMALLAPQEWRLVATEDGLPLYEKLGFRACGRILQHQGPVAAVAAPAGVSWATEADLPALAALDRTATGADRADLLAALARTGRLARLDDGTGFAALRPFGRGEVAGPVIARDGEGARRLLAFLFAGRSGAFLRVDTPEESGLAPWLVENGLAPVGGGVAMTRGTPVETDGSLHPFALAAQALG